MNGMAQRIKPDPKRYCQFCQRRLARKRINGRLEDMGAFTRRKFCDRLCMAQAMVQPTVSKATFHSRARKFRLGACERCGATRHLHVHHKDGNYTNNDPANLETLCERCHGKEHGPRRGLLFSERVQMRRADLQRLCDLLRRVLTIHPDRAEVEDLLHRLGHLDGG